MIWLNMDIKDKVGKLDSKVISLKSPNQTYSHILVIYQSMALKEQYRSAIIHYEVTNIFINRKLSLKISFIQDGLCFATLVFNESRLSDKK